MDIRAFLFLCVVSACNAALVLGPIIGRVTSTTARVLIESDTAETITVRLTAGSATFNNPQAVLAKEPYVFEFTGLSANTKYTVTVVGATNQQASSFTTWPANPTLSDKLIFVVSACNRYEKTRLDILPTKPNSDVWKGLENFVLSNNVASIFHIGDEVYSDDWHKSITINTLTKSLNLLNSVPASQWESKISELRGYYRDLYIQAWNHPATKTVLANAPNIMQSDDHEYADDLGDQTQHKNTSSPEYFLFNRVVRGITMLYERQLFDNVADVHTTTNPAKLSRENHFIFSAGEYAFIVTDSRAARYFKTPDSSDPTPFLTKPQWDEIEAFLNTLSARQLLFFTQVPLVIFPRSVVNALETKGTSVGGTVADYANDLQGMWEYGTHATEQSKVLNVIKKWLDGSSSTRRATLIGGDIHLLGLSEIQYKNNFLLRQMIVGPASGDSNDKKAVRYLMNTVASWFNSIDSDWEFDHCHWELVRNVGVVRTDPGHPQYSSLSHILGVDPSVGSERTLCNKDIFRPIPVSGVPFIFRGPGLGGLSSNTIVVRNQLADKGDAYCYALASGSTAPSASVIQTGPKVSCEKMVPCDLTIGSTANTLYDLHCLTKISTGAVSSTYPVYNFSTPESGAVYSPSFIVDPDVKQVAQTTIDIYARANLAGTLFCLISDVKPGGQIQVKSGANKTGCFDDSWCDSVQLTGLTVNTQYTIWCIYSDASGMVTDLVNVTARTAVYNASEVGWYKNPTVTENSKGTQVSVTMTFDTACTAYCYADSIQNTSYPEQIVNNNKAKQQSCDSVKPCTVVLTESNGVAAATTRYIACTGKVNNKALASVREVTVDTPRATFSSGYMTTLSPLLVIMCLALTLFS